jgi:DNA-binding CsgD family transcriptional regulator
MEIDGRHPHTAGVGFILADAKCQLIHANLEARRILGYSSETPPPKIKAVWAQVRNEVVSLLANQGFSRAFVSCQSVLTFGRRRYVCRVFRLQHTRGRRSNIQVAVILERSSAISHVVADLCTRYRLTTREREVVEFTIQGLTNKEIATRMKISPNTVRAFARTVMGKLGVSSRSGIVGVVFREGQGLFIPRVIAEPSIGPSNDRRIRAAAARSGFQMERH